MIIDTKLISDAVYKLCAGANTIYSKDLYKKILAHMRDDESLKYKLILENIKLAYETKRPLCQDTGQVIVFVKIPQNVQFCGDDINAAVNDGVKRAYTEFYFRKSVVKDALFDRENTKDNTPAIVYYEFGGEDIKIDVLVKGAGAENYSAVKMFKPSDSEDEICDYICESVNTAGEKVCPPVVLGIGIGGTMEYAALLSKKAFFCEQSTSTESLKEKLRNRLNNVLLDAKVLTAPTHIASLPVAVTINCHCTRHASCIIRNEEIFYNQESPDFVKTDIDLKAVKVKTNELYKLRSIAGGSNILLSGEIYTARDAAHARFFDIWKNNKEFPVILKDKIIFYAGPCPAAPGEIIGPVGPTTSMRMNKYADLTFNVLQAAAVIGKGECPPMIREFASMTKGRYLTAVGGVSCVLSKCVERSEIVAFDDLGAEAVYKLIVKDLPLRVVM